MSSLQHKRDQRDLFVGIGIVFVVITFFFPVLFNGFATHDDPGHLLENPNVLRLSWQNVQQMFSTLICQTYIPLSVLTFSLEHALFGFNPFVYHLNNLALHLAVVWLIYQLARRWFGFQQGSAALAALLFGIHPMHVESVAWVTERKDVLYSFFYLLSVHQYCQYIHTQKEKHFLWTVLFGLLSVLSKAMALSLPFVLMLFDWYFKNPVTKKSLIQKMIIAVVLAPAVWLTYSHNARVIPFQFEKNILSWLWCLNFYPLKFFWPEPLMPVYSCPKPVSLWNPHFYGAIFTLGIMVWMLIVFRRQRLLLFAAGYYVLSIFFLLRFDDVVDVNFVADRFMYLPSLGICLWLGGRLGTAMQSVDIKTKQGLLLSIGIGLVFLGCGLKTFWQARLWGDGIAFWTHQLKYNINSFVAYDHRGYLYSQLGQHDAAIADYDQALRLNPKYVTAYNNRGILFGQLQQYESAFKDFDQALKINPREAKVYFNRGRIYDQMRKEDEAIVNYSQALAVDSQYEEAWANRGAIYLRQGQRDLALRDFKNALDINPNDIYVLNNRAILYAKEEDYQQALKDLNASIAIHQNDAETFFNRGLVYLKQGETQKAVADFNQTLKLNPYHEAALKVKLKLEHRL